MIWITIGLAINVVVAGLIGLMLLFDHRHMVEDIYGGDTAAKRILSSLYLAIAAVSVWALASPEWTLEIAFVLFPLQIVYKLLTLPVVGDLENPVPWSNLAISGWHGFALVAAGWAP